MNIKPVDYADLQHALTVEATHWVVLSAASENENSFCKDALALCQKNDKGHARRWPVQNDASQEAVLEALKNIQQSGQKRLKLIVDVSELSPECIVHLCDALMGADVDWQFDDVFFVISADDENITPPELTSKMDQEVLEADSADLLIFPGNSERVSTALLDGFSRHEGMKTVAMQASKKFFAQGMKPLVHHAELLENVVQQKLNLAFYFSEPDALRVAFSAADKAADWCVSFPDRTHAFVIAPCASRWSIIAGCMARERYVRLCRSRAPNVQVVTSILSIPNQLNPTDDVPLKPPKVFQLEM